MILTSRAEYFQPPRLVTGEKKLFSAERGSNSHGGGKSKRTFIGVIITAMLRGSKFNYGEQLGHHDGVGGF